MVTSLTWLVVMAAARLAERSWWSPGALMAAILGVSSIGAYIFAPEYYQSDSANLALQALTLVMVAGHILGRSGVHSATHGTSFRLRHHKGLLIFGYGTSAASLYFTLQAVGADLASLIDPSYLMRVAQSATMERYTDGIPLPLSYNVANSLFLVYAAAVAIDSVCRHRFDYRNLPPLLIYGLSNTLITTRGPLIFMMIIMLSAGAYAYRLQSPLGEFPRAFSRRSLLLGASGTILVAALFFYFQVLRFGEQSTRSADDVWAHLRRWPWGGVPGLSIWLDTGAQPEAPHLPGFYTFMGIFDNLGIETRVAGAYTERILLTSLESSNIFTAFRGLYHDFGVAGTLVFILLVGVLGGMAITGGLGGPRVSLSAYVAVFGFVAWSPVVSFWAYTANIAATLMLPLALRLLFESISLKDWSARDGTFHNSGIRKLQGLPTAGHSPGTSRHYSRRDSSRRRR